MKLNFTVSRDQSSIKEASSGSYIFESGLYPLTLKHVTVSANDHGAQSLDFMVEYEGTMQTIYGLKLHNNNGEANFQAKIFNNLCIVADITLTGETEPMTLNVGKDQTPKDFNVLTEFDDIEVLAWIQYEYNVYNGEIKEKRHFKGFYRASDKASAEEIINDLEPGSRVATIEEKYADTVVYKDGLDEAQVKAFKESKRNGNAAPVQAAAPAVKPATNLFAS